MTKLFSKNLHRSQDLLFLKSLVGSNACIQHEKALLVSARKRLLLLFVYHAKWFLFKNLIWKITIINNLQSSCRSTFLVIKNEKKKSYNYFSNESHSNDDYGFFSSDFNIKIRLIFGDLFFVIRHPKMILKTEQFNMCATYFKYQYIDHIECYLNVYLFTNTISEFNYQFKITVM